MSPRERLPGDRPIPWRDAGGPVGPGLGLLVVIGMWAAQPDLVTWLFVLRVHPWVERVLEALTGWLPFSLAEWLQVTAIAWVLVLLIPAAIAVVRRQRRFGNAALFGAIHLLHAALVLVPIFYLTWGLNYARRPLLDTQGWTAPDPDGPAADVALAALADALVDRANAAYLHAHGSGDAGRPTAHADRRALDAAIEAGWDRTAAELGLPAPVHRRRPPAKPLATSAVFSRLGISGFYFPYTAEANYNHWTPGWQLPHTIAHEKAHQRGYASEDEASFLGFVACIRSPDPIARYSGWLFAQRMVLFGLGERDPEGATTIVARRLPGVQRDVDASRAFWASMRGRAADLSQAVNDAYLTANRVRGGIDSYGLATDLIVAWADAVDLQLDPPAVR